MGSRTVEDYEEVDWDLEIGFRGMLGCKSMLYCLPSDVWDIGYPVLVIYQHVCKE